MVIRGSIAVLVAGLLAARAAGIPLAGSWERMAGPWSDPVPLDDPARPVDLPSSRQGLRRRARRRASTWSGHSGAHEGLPRHRGRVRAHVRERRRWRDRGPDGREALLTYVDAPRNRSAAPGTGTRPRGNTYTRRRGFSQ